MDHAQTPSGAPSPDYIVRDLTRADYPQWLPLWDGYNAFYGRSGPTALPAGVTRTTWERFFEGNEPVHALVAERGGRLLGLVHFIFHRSTIHTALICYLQDLFTAADVRGTGVGRSLIQGVRERAKAAGAGRVYWHTHQTNATAMRLYDKLAEPSGFVVYRMDL